MTAIFTWLASVLSGPVVNGLLDAYKAKLASVNSTDQKAVDLAVADLNAQIEGRRLAASLAGTPLGLIQRAFGWVAFSFFAKAVVWDSMLGWGSTPDLVGSTATVYTMVVGLYFGAPIVSGAVNRVVGRFGR